MPPQAGVSHARRRRVFRDSTRRAGADGFGYPLRRLPARDRAAGRRAADRQGYTRRYHGAATTAGAGRPGTGEGTITGLFSVLVDGGDHNEPVADAVRAISTATS